MAPDMQHRARRSDGTVVGTRHYRGKGPFVLDGASEHDVVRCPIRVGSEVLRYGDRRYDASNLYNSML